MKSLTKLRNECESNKNTIVAIKRKRDDAMVLSDQLSENDEDRVKEIDTLIVNIKTLETKMTDAEMKLSAKDIELERIRNDALVLTQEKIENEKIMREKVVIKDNQIEEFVSKVADLKNDCESNENNIVAIITERDDAMKLSDKLSKNDEDRVKEINRLIVINKTLETKMTDAEITLLANDEELERIRNNAIALTQEKIENEKIMREKDVIQDNQIEEFVSKVADLKNECESNKNTIVAITSERNNAMELSEKLSENDEDRVKEINHLIIDNKTLKKEMTDAEMKLSAKGIELERIRKDAIVLKQEKIENEKMMREKDVIQDNKMQEFITKITELKQTCESNKNAIIAITSERDDAMELSDKLSENDEDRVKEINRLVFDNKIYETRATNAEIALSTKNDEIERIRNDTIILTQEKTENEKIMREKDVSQDKEMQEFVTKITELKNECESNKNTIAAITTERDDALELSDKLSDNDKDRVKEMNTLFVNIKSLETKVTNTEITLSAKDIELERIRNDALVLKQEKIENEKIMIEKTFNQDNEMQEFVTKITELKNECESNKIIIVAITSERDDAMELSDKLTENDEDRVKEINRLIFDNKTLETKMNDTEITLSAKNVELKEKDIKLLKYTRHGSEHNTNLRVTSEKLTSLEEEVRNKENFGDPLLQRSVKKTKEIFGDPLLQRSVKKTRRSNRLKNRN